MELWGVQCLNVVKHGGEVDVQSEGQHSHNHLYTHTTQCTIYIDVIICFRPKV